MAALRAADEETAVVEEEERREVVSLHAALDKAQRERDEAIARAEALRAEAAAAATSAVASAGGLGDVQRRCDSLAAALADAQATAGVAAAERDELANALENMRSASARDAAAATELFEARLAAVRVELAAATARESEANDRVAELIAAVTASNNDIERTRQDAAAARDDADAAAARE